MADPFKEAEVEDLAFELLFKKDKSIKQAREDMQSRGYEISDYHLKKFKDEMFSRLIKEDRRKKFADSMLNSIDRITEEFDDLYDRTKKLVDKLENEGRDYEAMMGIRELRQQITVALKRLGEFRQAINNMQADEVNIVNTQQFITAVNQIQKDWFETMDAELEDGRLIFNKPKAEVVDSYRTWKSREKIKA